MKDKANDTQDGELTGSDILAYIVKEFGEHYHPDSIYYLPNHMGFSWITSRSKHDNTLMGRKATRPRAEKQQFEYAYLFGSVCRRRGIGEAIIVLGFIKTS
ncbi:winged helix-turn-helix domain-containing protein [Vibrio parahaemolyticus]|nr:winged helix-turn-helix domain-containing protein [Vibrio parahaemolyticus]TOB53770.1 hypothetical protein CGK03_22780 [Vibrio parahaemolyticus]